jgi:hypothetical protein
MPGFAGGSSHTTQGAERRKTLCVALCNPASLCVTFWQPGERWLGGVRWRGEDEERVMARTIVEELGVGKLGEAKRGV